MNDKKLATEAEVHLGTIDLDRSEWSEKDQRKPPLTPEQKAKHDYWFGWISGILSLAFFAWLFFHDIDLTWSIINSDRFLATAVLSVTIGIAYRLFK